MADSLKYLIDRLSRTKIIASHPAYLDTLNAIDKFAANDFYKAYLLGHFFKYKLDSDNLPPDDKSFLLDTIKNKKLDTYYYLKTKPDSGAFGKSIYLFVLLGLVSITVGTIQLINGNFWYGLGTKYLVPVIREGGYEIIFGLILLIGGLIRLRHEMKKRRFLKSFLAPTNNSN